MTVGNVEFKLRDICTVGLDRRLVLLNGELLVLIGLFGDRFLLVQLGIAGKIGTRLRQARLILGQLCFGLLLVDFVLARIDLRQELALHNFLALLIANRGQIAAQLRQYINGRYRRDRTEFAQGFRHVAQGRRGGADDLRRRRRLGFLAEE